MCSFVVKLTRRGPKNAEMDGLRNYPFLIFQFWLTNKIRCHIFTNVDYVNNFECIWKTSLWSSILATSIPNFKTISLFCLCNGRKTAEVDCSLFETRFSASVFVVNQNKWFFGILRQNWTRQICFKWKVLGFEICSGLKHWPGSDQCKNECNHRITFQVTFPNTVGRTLTELLALARKRGRYCNQAASIQLLSASIVREWRFHTHESALSCEGFSP